MSAIVHKLTEALREAQAGLEFALDRPCRCTAGFVCTPHLALNVVRAALVDATEGKSEVEG